jgi:hypothetical protein
LINLSRIQFITQNCITDKKDYPSFLEWVPFDRFNKLGFAKVYSAKWINGQAYYYKQDDWC